MRRLVGEASQLNENDKTISDLHSVVREKQLMYHFGVCELVRCQHLICIPGKKINWEKKHTTTASTNKHYSIPVIQWGCVSLEIYKKSYFKCINMHSYGNFKLFPDLCRFSRLFSIWKTNFCCAVTCTNCVGPSIWGGIMIKIYVALHTVCCTNLTSLCCSALCVCCCCDV